MNPIKGLHHITAVASDPQINVDFYQRILGQRLIKTTVNFDDPGTYHLYYGDNIGTPGSILTFFPWSHMSQGLVGNGEAAAVSYAIDPQSVGFWRDRLKNLGVQYGPIEERFGLEVIPFQDPDGMTLELVAHQASGKIQFWESGPIPEQHAIQGFYGVTLWLPEVEATAEILTSAMKYRFISQEGERYRFQGDEQETGFVVDLLHRPGQPGGVFGAGSIHHIAFRVQNDFEQAEYQEILRMTGQYVTPVRDRQYFRSIYFRTPNGVLFEIATDNPGFAIDEHVSELGSRLMLPPWLEPQRQQIEIALPTLERDTLKTVQV